MRALGGGYAAEKWEKVDSYTERLEVPGGWLYRYTKFSVHQPMCFVPTPPPIYEVTWLP